MKVQFKHWTCTLELGVYANGRLAIILKDANAEAWDPSPVAVATVNLPDIALASDFIFVKDWAQNEGMMEALVQAGLVKDIGLTTPSGHVQVPLARLTPEAKAFVEAWRPGFFA